MAERPRKTKIDWLFDPRAHAIVYGRNSWIYLSKPQYISLLCILATLKDAESKGRDTILLGELITSARGRVRIYYAANREEYHRLREEKQILVSRTSLENEASVREKNHRRMKEITSQIRQCYLPEQGGGSDIFRSTLWKMNCAYVEVKAKKRAILVRLNRDGRAAIDEYARRTRPARGDSPATERESTARRARLGDESKAAEKRDGRS